jgi:hypothetical protein
MPAYYDFFRKIKFSPGAPTTETAAVMLNSDISGTTLTVGTLQSGTIGVGMTLSGTGIQSGTYIIRHISGSENGSTWEVNLSQTVSSTTITATLSAITADTTIEADSTHDTATVVAGKNITFSVKDSTDPQGLDQHPDFTIDKVIINGPDYQTYIPLGTTKLRLEKDLGSDTSDIEFVPDPASSITINRLGSNLMQIGSTSPTLPFSQEQIEDLSASLLLNGTHDEVTVTYQDSAVFPNSLIPDATSGTGSNATFDVWVALNLYNTRITAPGTGYNIGDTVTFLGTNFPNGTSPANDLVLTIGTVDGLGGILTITTETGTPPQSDAVSLAVTSTLSDVTGRGATTSDAITISNATGSSNTSTGALKLTAGGLAVSENANIGGYVQATTLRSTQATGTAPLTVASTTMVSNLQAETASKWHTARTVTFTGDVTGSFSIDGSTDVSNVELTVGPDKVELGTDTTGSYVAIGAVSGNGLSGSANSESATFTVSSNATAVNVGETIVFRDINGDFAARNISAGTVTANLTGVATKADTLLFNGDHRSAASSNTANSIMARDASGVFSALRYDGAISGGGTGQLNNLVKIGWGGSQLLLEVDVTDFGSSWPIGITGAFNGTTVTASDTVSLNASTLEEVSVIPSALTGTITLDCKTNSVFYYTVNASANWAINFRGDGATTMNTFLTTGKALTVVLLATQGGAAYYPTTFNIDGAGVTPRWLGGSAPTGGNASGIDSYTFTIIKTGSGAYTVLASQARFA